MTIDNEALAKKRFLAMNLIRLSGVVMLIVGLLFATDKVDVPQPPRHMIGIMLILIGLADAIFVPALLAKRWKSPDA